jgi:urease gamma subunit
MVCCLFQTEGLIWVLASDIARRPKGRGVKSSWNEYVVVAMRAFFVYYREGKCSCHE